ncbi:MULTISPECIES: 3D-(3,5/4)-trihydroxycyclohexane-1,2-dione acylhydrolase (decyclizing) [Heyndrickxia]|jgi:3D-(3,5/4)-trihydroxycyclohexane-1,2-dione acylhydrolase (decyclizing)|uniref:3D-(3,5/4)-trihydroxycyclohexane-1,2-dione acylhydrolase (decyclizing) n=1 Tax=Heyndrickxia TaxID=2837504 RepID=UPI00036555FC|nr:MULTISPECIES: 3D-(3,5/4)-trihydroxycyclohexane-1,2-dione acylhydrolase (decyclizing) [Heyndrickxia]APB37382.1 3D-(3,5/4)-trihydroxycyclohexane-1,2-dione acylhydrolase (decyclizing) [Heyndrickxia coagulans]MEC2224328.1 3D-(3,5/4)-trihydroxycyclohexane-1,2-dione acylhydrolase (decyclizing) [Weizmannia sp. CD-2023]MEC2304136.1 3D-(3,5/4)-trihydroxycyclohexane-1,2-dione acylhydrolase (decyclizing) [Weizmannia sp. CD-2023]MEC2339292.1 3D-(3,5/4)-trihydroxycyclohexane-1,2-dione acylhydrolase (decy
MGKIRLTTAQALIKFLNQQYLHVDGEEFPFVEGIFTVFGHGNVLGIGQALEQDPGHLKVFQGKNEQGMAHAAIAYSKQMLRRKIFAVTTSVGPGSANLAAAAGTALANNIPVLLIPGDTFATRQPDPVLQQVEHEYSLAVTTNDALKPVSRYWDRVTRPEQLMSTLIRAFEVMTDPGKAGPATICIAQDVEGEAFDFDEQFFRKRVHYLDRKAPSERELKGAAALIRASKKPLILVGGGAKYAGARDILMEISERHNIPLVETQAGKATVECTFKNNLGGMGITGTLAANKAARQADLVIGIGTRYTDFATSSKTAFDFEKARFLNINVSRMQAYKLDAFQVVADAKTTLEQLAPLLVGYESEFGSTIAELKNEWEAERKRLSQITFSRENFVPEIKHHFTQETLNEYADTLNTELAQTTALIAVNDAVDPESIIITSAGSLPGDVQRIWNSTVPNTYNVEYGYSCMGYEVSGALGIKLAAPDKEVYSLVGDGSFLMLHSELVTAIQYGKKINVVLFDNSGFGCINNLQMDNGGDSYFTEFRTHDNKILNIDYAKVAEGYGAKTYRVHTLEQLKEAIEDAKKQRVSTLIEIKVLPKTMTDGYESWWNVGVAEVSEKESIQKAYQERQQKLETAKQY